MFPSNRPIVKREMIKREKIDYSAAHSPLSKAPQQSAGKFFNHDRLTTITTAVAMRKNEGKRLQEIPSPKRK